MIKRVAYLDMDIQSDHVSTASPKRKPVHKSRGSSLSLPKLKKIKRDLLTDLPLSSHECQSEILPLVRKSFHWTTSSQTYVFKRVQSVHNPDLTAKYLEKRRDMKSFGYPDSLVVDTYAFLLVDNPAEVERICRNGVRCGNQKFSGLGVSHMAVHLCKHADILAPSRPTPGDKICLVVKVLKGKVKSVVCRSVGIQLEPTPNFDCHIAKPNSDPSVSLPPHLLFYSLQLYVYEYGDLGMEDFPKQILPYAVVHYVVREPPLVALHIPSYPSHMQGMISKAKPQNGAKDSFTGPKNEIWKGRLHIKLIGGGHIYIEVSIFSHFVPLAITLMSPVKVSHTYPNTNAQLTFLAGLSDIANKPEVPWKDHFFRSFVMKPSASSELHFKALVRHISKKQEMAAVRLPKEIYLFLMPKCLLASQLGLVQADDSDTVLYCVLMSKVSTIKKHKGKLEKLVGKKSIRKCGKAANWEELFEDSDKDEEEASHRSMSRLNHASMSSMFEQQRYIQNRLAVMSLEEANAIFLRCSCGKPPALAAEMQRRRNVDVERVVSSIHAQAHSRHSSKLHFPPGSRTKPKQRLSRHARAMPSFSPHGSSSDSDSDDELGHRTGRHGKRLSILDNKKTVEEELSEEELTNEQMEAIIFMRKPATTALSKPSSLKSHPSQPQSQSQSHTESKQSEELESKAHPDSPESPVLLTEPKIIPMEPLDDDLSAGIASPTNEEVPIGSPIIIPTEPVSSPKPKVKPNPPHSPAKPKGENGRLAAPKSILKKSTSAPVLATDPASPPKSIPIPVSLPEVSEAKLPDLSHQNDMGDVDMRIIPMCPATLSGPFLSASSTSHDESNSHSINWSQGSWLAPGELPPSSLHGTQTSLLSDLYLPHSPSLPQHGSPASPDASPPSNSPPSPSPLSPGLESLPIDSPPSPVSSPPMAETESPASPPQSSAALEFQSVPIAIPTVRIQQSDSPCQTYNSPNPFSCQFQTISKSPHKSEAENADDMMEFLNSAATSFDSDSSPFEDER